MEYPGPGVASTSVNKTKAKREKLLKNATYYKSVIKTWEDAVYKAEGRKPGKHDFATAPESVQKAYKEYCRVKKYLQGNSCKNRTSEKTSNKEGPSPNKIFFRQSSVAGKKSSGSPSPYKSPTSKISPRAKKVSKTLKDKAKEAHSSRAMQHSKHSNGVSFNVFKEKMSFVVNVLGKRSPVKKQISKVVLQGNSEAEAGDIGTRKVLIPSRFSKSSTLRCLRNSSMSFDCLTQQSVSSDLGCRTVLDEADHITTSSIPVIENKDAESSENARKRSSVSAIWHGFSPNPKAKNKSNTKQVDTEWLKRCRIISQNGEDVETDENSGANQCNKSIELDSDDDEGRETSNVSSSQQLFVQSFAKFLMSAESPNKNENICSENNHNPPNTNESCFSIGVPDNDTFDSGLGGMSNTVFSAQEILDVIANEVLPETASSLDKNNIHNENACSPPEQNLQTIDMCVISNLISANPFASAITPSNVTPRTPERSTLKRKSVVLFSPSPKKPSPTKKFFKSNRIKAKYGIQSYKPPTPSKKTNVRVRASTAAVTKNKTSKLQESSQIETNTNQRPPTDDSETTSTSHSVVTRSSKRNTNHPLSFGCEPQQQPPISQSVPSNTTSLSKVEYFDEAAQDSYGTGRQRGRKRRKLANGESGDTRIRKGKINENFVKIDITKKVFVRGHKKISGSKAKRDDWKMKKAFASKEEKLKSLVCRKCGETGHFRKFCMKDIIPTEVPQHIDDSPFPSLEEAATMANTKFGGILTKRVNVFECKTVSQDPNEENITLPTLVAVSTTPPCENEDPVVQKCGVHPIEPHFASEDGLLSREEEDEILDATIRKFGYDDFRQGQRAAVSRILKGLSTLCVLSTGSGKSLCYQLPAYLYAQKNPGALAICVSPLVSLMEDQVEGIPHFLHAAFLHSNMPSSEKEKVLDKIRSKTLHILLVSPEAVCGGLFGILRGNDLPQISFACIDEVHCVSQWSHNFRPCYLQLAKILREKLRVTTILGLTATATEYTAHSICRTLHIDPSTTIRGEIIPINLNLSASRDTYRDEALLALLQGERFSKCDSIIIYCTRRDECQRIAALIRTSFQDPRSKHAGVSQINMRQRVSNTCEAYHAGMTAGKRRLVQQQFMSGKIRIVVATIAFGMGIDKSDIRAVIHYNMPKNFESYVQEIGRAGRDGEPAHCHLFLDNVKGRDLSELKRHVFCNSIDRATLRKLLRRVFQPCKCDRIAEFSHKGPSSDKDKTKHPCPGHEVSFSIDEAVHELDLPQENITTILCYLELDSNRKWIEMLPHTYQTCKIHSYGGAALLKSAALKCPPLAAAIALKRENKTFKDSDVYLEFNVIEVSATLGWNSGAVKRELKNLEWTATNFNNGGNGGKFRKSAILVEFCNLAFHLNAPGDLSDEDSDSVLNYLHNLNQEQEKMQLYQLHRVYQALLSISNNTAENVSETFSEEKSNALKQFIHTYFLQKTLDIPSDWKAEITYPDHEVEEIRRNIGNLLSSVKDAQFTGRSVAKIFQGIPSPCFPAEDWARNRAFWRKHIECDFHFLCKIAGQEILRF